MCGSDIPILKQIPFAKLRRTDTERSRWRLLWFELECCLPSVCNEVVFLTTILVQRLSLPALQTEVGVRVRDKIV